jgi:hypothetical protein
MGLFLLIQPLAAQSKETGKNMSHEGFFDSNTCLCCNGKSKFYLDIPQKAYTIKVRTITCHEFTEGGTSIALLFL